MNSPDTRGAVEALLDEHDRAMLQLLAMIDGWNDETLDRTILGPPNDTYREVLQHVARAAYLAYFVWIQRVLDWEIVPAPVSDREDVEKVHSLDGLRDLLRGATPYGRKALANLTDKQMEPTQYPSGWELPYTIEQMLEHAIVHIWRHLRQLQRAEAALEA